MKIKFDENISPRLVDAILAWKTDKNIQIGSVHRDYYKGITMNRGISSAKIVRDL